MPSSDPQTIPKVLQIVRMINPESILDVGCGNGRYGFLFRESLDWDYGRLKHDSWEHFILGIEAEEDYLTPIHEYCYDSVISVDWMNYETLVDSVDLIFMGDVLEHFAEGEWQKALKKAWLMSRFTIVVAPNWRGSIAQGAWEGYEHEAHRVALTPQKVGGRCLFANSKTFICIFDNESTGLFEGKDVCL